MKHKWAHLPNAKHIDAVLANVKTNPDKWDAARDAAGGAARGAAWDAAWDAARGAARDAAWDAARGAAWDAARGAARDAARDAAWGAVSALIAWDDAADVFLMPADAVKLLKECGDPRAILMYPAVLAMTLEERTQ